MKTYGSGEKSFFALNHVDLDLPEKGLVCVLGPPGCGKTTLLNLLGGLDTPTFGRIYIDGTSLESFKSSELDSYRNQKVGFIFQDYDLIPGFSILENVKLSLSIRRIDDKSAQEKALKALEAVGLADKLNSKPSQLSGGQKQRTAIARAISGDPQLILADEPTGALDTKSGEEVLALLKEQSRKRLVVVVTHNEQLAEKYADRIIHMQDGKILDEKELEPILKEDDEGWKLKRVGLGLWNALKFGFSHITHRFGRFAMVSLASSLGIIVLAFSLCITNGFGGYVERVNRQTGSTMSYIVPAYTSTSDSEGWEEVNQSQDYPDADEIYPYYTPTSSTTYVYNGLDSHYMQFLNQLKTDGILSDYIVNYSGGAGIRVLTEEPQALATSSAAGVIEVDTQRYAGMAPGTGGMPYAPTSIFHPLFGDYKADYDLLAGRLPQNENELVLIVDKRNAIDFNTLKALGFYNYDDTQEDVLDPSLDSKVKPFSFSQALGKQYKIYSLDDYYTKAGSRTVVDALNVSHAFDVFYHSYLDEGKSSDALNLQKFYNEKKPTVEATIVGIIRPSSEVASPAMRTGIGYLQSLSEDIATLNRDSAVAKAFNNSFVLKNDVDIEGLLQSLQSVLAEEKETSSTEIQQLVSEYFIGYAPVNDGYKGSEALYYYTSVGGFFSDSSSYMASLMSDSIHGLELTDKEALEEYIDKMAMEYLKKDYPSFYSDITSLCAASYSFSNIDSITLVPTSLETTATLNQLLDDYNDIVEGSVYHAQDEKSKVYAQNYVYYMTESIGKAVSMVNTILIVVACLAMLAAIAISTVVTNMSVMERTKEIGVLRALGSSKKDVALSFEVEAFMAGLLGGLLGTFFAWILTYPVNAIINLYYPSYDVGQISKLAWWHPLVMVPIAIALMAIAAFWPSLSASKKDPVKCLRSEE